jgi:hypothetical protein
MRHGNLDVDFEGADVFQIGDAVRLKNKIVKSATYKMLGPRRLISVGWPNHFYVERVGTSEGEPVITLSACCYNLGEKDGSFQCKGHPTSLFEKVAPEIVGHEEPPPPRRKGDHFGSVVTPLGKVASYEYRNDEQNPELVIDILGKKFSIDGSAARKIADLAKEKGLL